MKLAIISIIGFVTKFASYISAYNDLSRISNRILDISVQDDSINLQTNVNRYVRIIETQKNLLTINNKIQVDLYGMLHIGDKCYYNEISNQMKHYDLILYELITSPDNILEESSFNDGSKQFKKKLKTNVYSKQMENLGKSFNLTNQLDELDLLQANWYIADLSSDVISSLETKNRMKVIFNYWLNQLFGRNYSEQLIRKLLISDRIFVSLLRLLVWLGPCPELSCLLLDWSRMPSPLYAGGLALLIKPIIQHSLNRDWQSVNKLLFAQQLLSGTIDAGSWGGDSKSDIEVRIKARNDECIRILDGFITEYIQLLSTSKKKNHLLLNNLVRDKVDMVVNDDINAIDHPNLIHINSSNTSITSNEILKIAVLYGIYHIDDLNSKLIEQLQFKPYLSNNAKQYTAWNIPAPPSLLRPQSRLNSFIKPSITTNYYPQKNLISTDSSLSSTTTTTNSIDMMIMSSTSTTNRNDQPKNTSNYNNSYSTDLDMKDILIISSGMIVYLLLGAIDWWVLYQFILHCIESFYSVQSNNLVLSNDNIQNLIHFQFNDYQKEILLTMIYLISYIQRHMFLLKKISYIGIQWDRGLFSDL